MIYLNNAATSFPKAPNIISSIEESLQKIPVGQFRSSENSESNIIKECKFNLSKFIKNKDSNKIFFTSGATESFNLIVNGLELKNSHVIVSATEHNSLLRPLFNSKDNIEISVIPCNNVGYLNPLDIVGMIKDNTKAIFINHISNVTGVIQDVSKIGEIAKKNNLIYVVDGSQSCGCLDIDIEKTYADIFVFTSHKALLSISGLGGFYLKDNNLLALSKYGGTGKNSSSLMLEKYSGEFEVGTQNIVAITALKHSCDYLLNIQLSTVYDNLKNMYQYLLSQLFLVKNIKLYYDYNFEFCSIISFNIVGIKSSDVAYILTNSYDIILRVGLHCAPLIHKYINTENDGTLRVSISYFTQYSDIDEFVRALNDIVNSYVNEEL